MDQTIWSTYCMVLSKAVTKYFLYLHFFHRYVLLIKMAMFCLNVSVSDALGGKY